MYHYTYLIQHKTENKRYIGVRTSKVPPIEDMDYWGSSKHLPENVKDTHAKIVLKEFKTREEALKHEMLLHDLNDVAKNPIFYNKAKQTSTGWDTTGVPIPSERRERIKNTLKRKVKEGKHLSKEHIEKIRKKLIGREFSEEHRKNLSKAQKKVTQKPGYVNPRKGVKLSEETKKKLSLVKRKSGKSKGINNNKFTPWFITYLDKNYTDIFYDKTKTEYSLELGYSSYSIREAYKRSHGIKPVTVRGLKNVIIGNIPNS